MDIGKEKEMKKVLIISMVICLISNISSTAFAGTSSNLNECEKMTGYVDITQKRTICADEILNYDKFKICQPMSTFNKNVFGITESEPTKNSVLQYCSLNKSKRVGSHTISTYTLENFNLLPECKKIVEITAVDDILYIQYHSKDGKEIILSYSDKGIVDLTIYDAATDKLTYISENEKSETLNFRNGSYYLISEEDYESVKLFLNDNNEASLPANFYVTESEDGVRVIEEKSPTMQAERNALSNIGTMASNTGYRGFQTQSAVLADLKSHFPILDTTSTFIRNCPYLSDDITVKVQTVRNDYVKVSASFRDFAVTTAVSVIATYLVVPVAAACEVLTWMGIAYSATRLIQEAVTLYKASEYDFEGAKYGRVFDELKYNALVNVKRYVGEGRFAGGYTSSGVFEWVESRVCSALQYSNGAVATTAAEMYNDALVRYGYCWFTPSTW